MLIVLVYSRLPSSKPLIEEIIIHSPASIYVHVYCILIVKTVKVFFSFLAIFALEAFSLSLQLKLIERQVKQ